MESAAPTGPLRVEDLDALPDDGWRYELEAGRLIREPPPGARHGWILIRLGRLLAEHVDRNGLGAVVGGDAGFVLARSPDTVRGPDVAFVARERSDPVREMRTVFPGAPDLAVEILSPSNRLADVRAKVADYLAAGTRRVWVVDPENRTVTTYDSLLKPRVLEGDAVLDGEDVIPGFALPLGRIFDV